MFSLNIHFCFRSLSLSESIDCSIPSLPRNARYLHFHPFMRKITDGNHLEYVCNNSTRRQRILCRHGKILPKNPVCYNGNLFLFYRVKK